MAETALTREQLLASVHALKPGDLLLRLPAGTSAQRADDLQRMVGARLDGTGVRVLVVTGDVGAEAYRATQDKGGRR